ncbi:hypothetical protein PMIN04_005368 [Paraphaeosphaeria minitans]
MIFEFVTVNHPHEIRDRSRQRRIRHHAICNGIQKKRKEEATKNENFITSGIDTRTGKLRLDVQSSSALAIAKPLSGGRLDPFDSLPGDGEHLRLLMAHSQCSCVNDCKRSKLISLRECTLCR